MMRACVLSGEYGNAKRPRSVVQLLEAAKTFELILVGDQVQSQAVQDECKARAAHAREVVRLRLENLKKWQDEKRDRRMGTHPKE